MPLMSCRARPARRLRLRLVRYYLAAEVWRGAWLRIAMMRTMLFPTLAYLVVPALLALQPQQGERFPYDRELVLELTTEDPMSIEGRGATKVVDYVTEFEGTAYIWATSEIDLYLRLEIGENDIGLGDPDFSTEDDNSGGGTTPLIGMEAIEGESWRILVAAANPGEVGDFELRIGVCVASAATRELESVCRKGLAEARRMRDEGDLDSARALTEELILAILDSTEAGFSSPIIRVLDDLEYLAYEMGMEQVEDLALRALFDHFERTAPREYPELLRIQEELAVSMTRTGEFESARKLLESVIAILERSLHEDHPDLARARSSLATVLHNLGDLDGALTLTRAGLASLERTLPPDHHKVLTARANLANSLFELGYLPEAHALALAVVDGCERTLSADDSLLLQARTLLALTMDELGDSKGSRKLRESVLASYERTLHPDHFLLIQAREHLAASMLDFGDFAGARAILETVLEAYSRRLPSDHPNVLAAQMNVASSMRKSGDYDGARSLQELVLAARERILPTDHHDLLDTRSRLAVSLKMMGDYGGARALQTNVLEAYDRLLPSDHPDCYRIRFDLANTLSALGDEDGALALTREVLTAYERLFPPDHPSIIRARANYATSLTKAGDLAGALALDAAVYEVLTSRLPRDHPELLIARQNLSHAKLRMGDLAGARALQNEQFAGIRAHVLGSLALAPRQARRAVATQSKSLARLLTLSAAAEPELRAQAFELIETMRLVATESARSLHQFDADPELGPILAEAASVRGELNNLIGGAGKTQADSEAIATELTRLVIERDRLEGVANRRLAERGVVTQPVSIQALAKQLDANEAVVGFRRIPRYFAIEAVRDGPSVDLLLAHVLRADGTLTRLDLGPTAEFEELARAWRAELGAPLLRGVQVEGEAGNLEMKAGVSLRERLLDPVLDAAGADVQRLFVCADDLVFLIPLEALPLDDEGAERLGDRVRIVSEVSFARLLSSNEPHEGEPLLLALGGVDYDAAGTAPEGLLANSPPIDEEENEAGEARATRSAMPTKFNKLLQSRYEAEATAELFEEAFDVKPALLTRKQTTKAALFEAAAGKRYVHLATHGWFAPESVRSTEDVQASDKTGAHMGLEERIHGFAPMTLCGLALAGANRGPDALGRVVGILTAEELCSMDLSSCELAVLSACETNVGIRRAGQGIQSLQAALYAAGARTSITSLWKVDDAATRRLMELFYTGLWIEKLPKSEALWQAKTAMRQEGHPPGAWAAWIMTGDPN